MKELVNNMLAEIEVNISEIDLYGYDIVETFLSIVRRLQAVLNDLKTKLQIHSFYKIVFIRPCMMNIMLFVESLIYAYVPIAHNSIKT